MILHSDDRKLYVSLPIQHRHAAKAIPGYRWDADRVAWTWPKSLVSYINLREGFPELEVDRDTSQWLRTATTTSDWSSLPQPSVDRWDDLRDYQQDGVNALLSKKHVLLADIMGTGKTVQACAAISALPCQRVLVLCPKSTVYPWYEHAQEWAPEYSAYILDGSTKKRKNFLDHLCEEPPKPFIAITNWEAALYVDFSKYPWDIVIGDEAHRVRNRQTKTYKAVSKMHPERLWLLTGTPQHNGPQDIWALSHWLYPTDFSSYWQFYEAFVEYTEGYWGREIIGAKNLDKLSKVIAPFTLRRTELRGLPDKLPPIPVHLQLGQRERVLYQKIEHDILIELTTSEKLFIPGALARLTRLKQAALDPALFGADKSFRSPKMDAAIDLIQDNPEESFLVFSQYAEAAKTIYARLQELNVSAGLLIGATSGKERQVQVQALQDGNIRVLCLTLGAGGEGLTLTGANNAIMLDAAWNPAVMDQAEARIHRIGQTRICRIYNLIVKDTIDETIQAILAKKRGSADAVLSPLTVIKQHFGLGESYEED